MVTIGKKERAGLIKGFASRLKFPWLFLLIAVLFIVDLLFPDPILFLDEVILGLLTVMLGIWREKRGEKQRPMKNITPPTSQKSEASSDS